MKAIIALLLAMVFCLAGCSAVSGTSNGSHPNAAASSNPAYDCQDNAYPSPSGITVAKDRDGFYIVATVKISCLVPPQSQITIVSIWRSRAGHWTNQGSAKHTTVPTLFGTAFEVNILCKSGQYQLRYSISAVLDGKVYPRNSQGKPIKITC